LRFVPVYPGAAAGRPAAPPRGCRRGDRWALLAKARGGGYRAIAVDLQRPPSTVRRWLRRIRGEHVGWLRRQGIEQACRFDPEVISDLPVQSTELGDALVALAAAVHAVRRRLARHAEAWTLIGVFTGGRLLGPTPAT